MVLKLYNTLTRKKQVFKSINKGQVGMYVCGPTVNDIPHLGHARQQITFDVLRRYLKFSGYKVKFVSNVTDIEDKIINKANELGIKIEELTRKNYKAHMEDYSQLNIEKPDIQPKATEYVKQMIDLVKKLEVKGYAYIIEGDGVYYDISKFRDYGKLSGQDIGSLKKGARSSELRSGLKSGLGKRNPQDFVLWKFSKPEEPSWKSPFGDGRPGWHIECSAMSNSILGNPFDIHGGGQDLIFPHHEDEIAQSEAGYGKKMVNYWVHNGMVNVNKVKMSKSLGNFKTIRDLLEKYIPEVIRYFVISNHYRKQVDFSKNTLDNAQNAYNRLKNIISEIKDDKKENKKYLADFEKAMDNDLNTPVALQVLWRLLRDKKAVGKINTIKKMDEVFGLDLLKEEKSSIPDNVRNLVNEREKARADKDWKKADELRNKINKLGWKIDDTDEGTRISHLN